VHNPLATDLLAVATRVGLELGADFVKVNYNNDIEGFKWVVKSAGMTKVVVAGGERMPDRDFLQKAYDVMQTGATGMAVGREVWQHEHPMEMTEAIKQVIFKNKTVDEAMAHLKKSKENK
jgi:class I fructose-bisphosphate aldolase